MENEKESPQRKKPPLNSYARYTGIAFQLVAVILLGIFIGNRIDKHFSKETPIFTLVFSLLFTVAALIAVARQLMKK